MHLLKPEDKSTPIFTIDSRGARSQIDSQVNTKKPLDRGKPQDIENTAESNRKSTKKQVMSTLSTKISSKSNGSSLEQEWDQSNQKLQGTLKASNTQET